MNRRKLFGFLAAAPFVGVGAAMAKPILDKEKANAEFGRLSNVKNIEFSDSNNFSGNANLRFTEARANAALNMLSDKIKPVEGRMYLMDDGEWVTINGDLFSKITVINGGPEDTFKTAIWMEPKDRA